MQPQLEVHPEGVVLLVRAYPGSRKNELRGLHQGALKVAVTTAPERGKANQAIALVLAAALDVRVSAIELLAGPTAREKRFLIRGCDTAEIRRRLAQVLPADSTQ